MGTKRKNRSVSPGRRGRANRRAAKQGVLAGVILLLAAGAFLGWRLLAPKDKPSSPQFAGPEPDPIVEPEQTAFAAYGGSASCKECHEEIYQEWAQSNHGLAERAPREDLDRAAFDPGQFFYHGTQRSQASLSNGVYQVTTPGLNGQSGPFAVERVIGHDPLRQFLVAAPRGRLQVLEATFDPRAREWFNVFGDEDRRPGEWGHWTGRGMTWNSMCASCHNTRLRKNYDETNDAYHTAMVEMTVGCEACHGPMKEHVDWCRARPGTTQAGPVPPPLNPSQLVDMCGTCHSRRYEVTGDFLPGDNYFDHFALTLVDDSDLYYPDGQIRDEDYEFASFLGSRMHSRGVTCRDCHHAHTMKNILPGNLLCLRCHVQDGYPNAPVIDEAAHGFHKIDDTGGQCVNCHMPQTPYMQRHWRHDHMFGIPDPLLTKQLGIPNACNRCHQDQSVDWALAAVEKWYGPKMERPSRHRARVIAAARRGDSTARDPLLALLQGEETPYWKAVAANLLAPWSAEPTVTRALVQSLAYTNPMVRLNAANSLAPLVGSPGFSETEAKLRLLLEDPVRSVRYQAAWALRTQVDPSSRAGRELRWALDFNADFPSGQMQKALYALGKRDLPQALRHYEIAVGWDPYSPPLRHELAIVLSMLGKPQQALEQMQEACRLAPHEAEYRFKLGLALNEVGQLDQAIQSLEETVRLNPRHARAWYNLALACQRHGEPARALDTLERGESLNPQDPGLPYTRATLLLQLGRPEAAREAANRALQIDPDHSAAQQLIQSLPFP